MRLEQPWKAEPPILSTPSRIVTVFRLENPEKVFPIFFIPIVTEVIPVQPWKAEFSILVTELGMVTEVRPEHLRKAECPILVTELGIMTEVRPEQFSKAPAPILVTEFGMVTEVRPEQP